MKRGMRSTGKLFIFILLLAGMAFAQSKDVRKGTSEWDNGIYFWKSQDGDFSGRFDGRAFINGAYFFENKNKLSNGTHLRKARLAIKMKLWKNWRTEWDMDIAEGVVEIKDMFLAYRGLKNSEIKFGHFKVPFGLEILTSSRYIAFSERAYNALAFKMGRRMALQYAHWGDHWNIRSAVYGQTFDTKKDKTKDETGGGFATRLAVAPIQTSQLVVHTGISAAFTNPDDQANTVDFKSEPETKIGDTEILNTGKIRNTDYTLRQGIEGAIAYKNYHLQAEYNFVQVKRLNNLSTAHFDGGYVYFLWTITGESRPWNKKEGEFGQLIPNNEKTGAWEIGLRFSHLNLSDTKALILGGRANNYTLALNWYANANMVFQLNFTRVETSPNATGNGFVGDDQFSYLQFMTKFFF